jgi:hypothetical protein
LPVGFVKKYRMLPALSVSFDARRRFPLRRLPGSSAGLVLGVLRSLVDLDSPVNLGSGSLRSIASAVVGTVAPIFVLLSMA